MLVKSSELFLFNNDLFRQVSAIHSSLCKLEHAIVEAVQLIKTIQELQYSPGTEEVEGYLQAAAVSSRSYCNCLRKLVDDLNLAPMFPALSSSEFAF